MSAMHMLHRAGQAVDAVFTSATNDAGITPRQWAILNAVSEAPGANQANLVAITGIDRSTLAAITRRLVEGRLLARKRSKEDARAYKVTLTEAGRKALEQGERAAASADEAVLAALGSKAAADAFLKALQKIAVAR